jgi:two-component system, LytTR family, sensor kinase
MKKAWYSNKWVTVLLHCTFWLLLFSMPFLLRPSSGDERPSERNADDGISLYYIVNNLFWIALFYLNALVLVPKILNTRKLWIFIAVHILLFGTYLGIGWGNSLLFKNHWQFNFRIHFLFTFFIYQFMLAVSTAYRLIGDRMVADQLAKEKENENLKTELSLLRSQVSPHFMFNVLNNMVALARKQSDQLEPSLIKLSSLMRYMLYETDGEKVSLEKEMDYLQSYIDLQRQRYGKNLQINVNFRESDSGYEIEPMLLIPFVENAFKHGTGFIENPQIDISLQVENKMLKFDVKNRFQEDSVEIKDKTSGIGLTNVQRRLQLLYGKNHQLSINKNDGWFTTSLQLKLS